MSIKPPICQNHDCTNETKPYKRKYMGYKKFCSDECRSKGISIRQSKIAKKSTWNR